MLTISHTAAQGTLIDGTSRGDGTTQTLKAHGWRWSWTLGQWFVPRSRDVEAKRSVIDATATAAALRAAGHDVSVNIDSAARAAADVERDVLARQEQRVEQLADRADKASAAADAAWRRDLELTGRMPLGQPILLGHHSQRRAERDQERAQAAGRAAVDAEAAAAQAAQAAETATHASGARYAPDVVGNRIVRLTAELASLDRQLTGHVRTVARLPDGTVRTEATPAAAGEHRARIQAEHARVADQLTFWRGVQADQRADGTVKAYSAQNIAPGDHVAITGGRWHRVIRANKTTVTLQTDTLGQGRVPYHHLIDHRPAPTAG